MPAGNTDRISQMTRAGIDPLPWLTREVAAADHLSRHGAPVVAPADLAEPGPHRVDGLALSL
ncbi:MAG TPA: hypothetical protein VMU94_25200 [Streptosporangiaceae bacterium]|nr:hypothetical protein [Streptosporangiaceae bacterium]